MSRSTQLNTRIDPEIKENASRIFNALGMSFSEAISVFLQQVIYHNGLPFELKIPNQVTKDAIRQAREDKALESFNNVDDMFKALKD